MSIFYQTQDGWYAGELIEDYDDCMLVEVKIAKGVPVVGCQYSLVKKPNTASHLTAFGVGTQAQFSLLGSSQAEESSAKHGGR